MILKRSALLAGGFSEARTAKQAGPSERGIDHNTQLGAVFDLSVVPKDHHDTPTGSGETPQLAIAWRHTLSRANEADGRNTNPEGVSSPLASAHESSVRRRTPTAPFELSALHDGALLEAGTVKDPRPIQPSIDVDPQLVECRSLRIHALHGGCRLLSTAQHPQHSIDWWRGRRWQSPALINMLLRDAPFGLNQTMRGIDGFRERLERAAEPLLVNRVNDDERGIFGITGLTKGHDTTESGCWHPDTQRGATTLSVRSNPDLRGKIALLLARIARIGNQPIVGV